LGKDGDQLTIMSFAHLKKEEISHWKPKVIVLNGNNAIITRR
jgi:aspartate 1-decarboxylase